MLDTPASRRPTIAHAAALTAVTLLFGVATFVAGLAIGGETGIGIGQAEASPTVRESMAPVSTGTPGPTPILETITCAEPTEAFAVLCETYAQIRDQYVDEITDEELVDAAVRGMVEYGLEDPYSGYLPPSQYDEALEDLSGEFSGIGAEVGMEDLDDPADLAACTVVTETCAMVVVAPLAGSPAEAAGLRAGDQILEIDGTSTVGESVSSLVYEVRGEAGTDVTLTVRRDDEEFEITITRAVIDLREVESAMIEDGIGYLRLTTFTDRAPELFRDALRALLDQGATDIVFDLRGNPGGYIVAARSIASEFVPAGELLFTVEHEDSVDTWVSADGGLAQDGAIGLVVLVDAGSASASEIVAAALQEAGRATLVGQPTFGKNTVQIWNDLPNGGGLRLTTDRWFTPSHDTVADGGVIPDVLVEGPEDPTSEEDPQLDRALEILQGG
ncbi:MAG: S41 family peptidase [Candidatus Limnocylindria bacterium]